MKKIVIRNVNYLLIGGLESLLTYINNGIIDSLNIKTIGKTNVLNEEESSDSINNSNISFNRIFISNICNV